MMFWNFRGWICEEEDLCASTDKETSTKPPGCFADSAQIGLFNLEPVEFFLYYGFTQYFHMDSEYVTGMLMIASSTVFFYLLNIVRAFGPDHYQNCGCSALWVPRHKGGMIEKFWIIELDKTLSPMSCPSSLMETLYLKTMEALAKISLSILP